MKPFLPILAVNQRVVARSGVSLSEVLVSVAIMSIGVVLISTLLPISILRTAQATQLTQAVFLRNNAEAAVESNLGLLSNLQIPFPAAPATTTNVLAVVDPLGYFLVGSTTTSTSFGEFSSSPPTSSILRTSGGVYNGGLADQAITLAQQANALLLADSLATLPDSFTLVAKGAVSSANINSTPAYVSFTNTSNVGTLNVRNSTNPQAANYRLVMFDISGQFAVIEPLKQVISGTELSWWDPADTAATAAYLPAGFTPATARIEVNERRFTWLMTVRKRLVSTASMNGSPDDVNGPGLSNWPWAAEIDIAVFYNRSFKPNDEFAYTVAQTANGFDGQPGVISVDDNNDGTIDNAVESGWLGSDDNRTVTVSFTAGNGPPLKKGGYMLEPTQLKWYRIMNFTPVYPSSTSSVVLLDQDVRSSPGITVSQGIFMKGIVEVYALGVRTGQR